MFNSEEEDDEDNKSCHSSSSDTLTCSIPEVNLANKMLVTLSAFLYMWSSFQSIKLNVLFIQFLLTKGLFDSQMHFGMKFMLF